MKIIGQNCKQKAEGLKNAVLNDDPQLRVPANKSSIAILHSDIIWLFFKKISFKKHHLNNFEFCMNLTSKRPRNVRISIKGNFPIKTPEVSLVFHNVICLNLYIQALYIVKVCLSEAASDRRFAKSSFCKISALKYKCAEIRD